ncbi:MAG: type II toxin-antitoxin system RelE family toxin [bacterium]
MEFEIFFHDDVHSDIKEIPKKYIIKIKEAINNKLKEKPEFYGIPLKGSLKPYRKFRIGDYRIVFNIEDNKIYILAISHRKKIYKIAENRKT